MANDPLGLQSNPLFSILGKIANPASYAGMAGKKPAAPGKMAPSYAQSMYAGEAANRGVAPKAKPKASPQKEATPVKKVAKKAKPAAKKAMKANPFSKGKTEAPGMKSKGKKADKMVTMKKYVNTDKKKK
jgi:hypothetical protein